MDLLPSPDDEGIPVPTCSSFRYGARHRQMFLVMCGFMMGHMQKAIISIGLVAMADTAANPSFPTVTFTTSQKGIIVSSFFYGYLVGCLPWALVATKYGPVKTLAIAGGILMGLITSSMPLVAIFLGYEATCAARVLQGFFFGSVLPSIHLMNRNWIVPDEREKFSWIFSGVYTGILFSTIEGFLTVTPGGWPSVFYFAGGLSVLYGIVCLKIGADTPAVHKTISAEEKDFILHNRKKNEVTIGSLRRDVPWRAILTSWPLWVTFISQSGERWVNVVNNFFPTFLHGVYGFSIRTNGIISSLPGLVSLLCGLIFPFLGHLMRKRTSLNFSRKFWSSVGFYIPSVIFFVLATVDVGAIGAVTSLTMTAGLSAAHSLGCFINTIDLAPNFAGILIGIVFTPTNAAAILSNTFTGYAVSDEHNLADWQTVFMVASILLFLANTQFLLFGSTEIQPWNEAAPKTLEESPKMNTEIEHKDPFWDDGTLPSIEIGGY